MKLILIASLLVAGYVFFPTYNLYIIQEDSSDGYTLAEKGFYVRKSCEERAKSYTRSSYGRLNHSCRKTSHWSVMYSNYTKYDPAIREARKRLQGE
jgi:hypothetical protein